jgi:hypothetical protein
MFLHPNPECWNYRHGPLHTQVIKVLKVSTFKDTVVYGHTTLNASDLGS